MPFSYEAPVVVITISKHVRTNHPDSSTYSELYQLSTEFPRPLWYFMTMKKFYSHRVPNPLFSLDIKHM